jgi:predicted transcriptional regulator
MTTIKVSKKLRERISASAAEQRQTIHMFLESMLDEHERRRRLAAVAAAYTQADEQTLEDWRTETDQWEAVDTDAEPSA